MIPSLPPKVFKGTTDVTEQHFTAARSRGLLAFLKATGNHPDLRNSKHLFLFVEASDAKFKGARDIATAQEETSTLLADKAWGWFGKAKEALKENETFKDLADKAGVQVLGGTGEDEKVVTAEDSEVAELVEFITQLEANLRSGSPQVRELVGVAPPCELNVEPLAHRARAGGTNGAVYI